MPRKNTNWVYLFHTGPNSSCGFTEFSPFLPVVGFTNFSFIFNNACWSFSGHLVYRVAKFRYWLTKGDFKILQIWQSAETPYLTLKLKTKPRKKKGKKKKVKASFNWLINLFFAKFDQNWCKTNPFATNALRK